MELKGGVGAGSGAGSGTWSSNPRNVENYSLDPPKSDFGSKMAFRLRFTIEIVLLGPFLEPLSKPENVIFAPGDRL